MPATITLTTDFGIGSPYVAQMKAVILGIVPDVQLVDITHAVQPQSVLHGALILDETIHHFPSGTIHVAVVDPGVGTDRAILLAELGDWYFIAPDNGLWTLLEKRLEIGRVVKLTNSKYLAGQVSSTFHGRDIMAPVAAHLAGGVPIDSLGPPATISTCVAWPTPRQSADSIAGQLIAADSFGNLISNITLEDLPFEWLTGGGIELETSPRRRVRFVATYGEASPGELVALLGSSGRLEIAKVNGSAAEALGIDGAAGRMTCLVDRGLGIRIQSNPRDRSR